MTQVPRYQCQYCGSQDIGEGWSTEKPWLLSNITTAGKSTEVSDLPPLRSSAVPVCGRTSPVPAGKKISLQCRRLEYYEERT